MPDGYADSQGFGTPPGTFGQSQLPWRFIQPPAGYQGNVLVVSAALNASAGDQIFLVTDAVGNPIFTIGAIGAPSAIGTQLGASRDVFGTNAVNLDPQTNPASIQMGFGHRIFGPAPGTPPATISAPSSPNVGDIYLRSDTPTTVNQRIYICTAAGVPGTWLGIV
jgi:hypothetical protein